MSMRVSFLMLLAAMALALAVATTAQARFDLVNHLHASKDVEECQKIPFLLCDTICDQCICDRRVPELAECTCGQWKQTKPDPHAECQKNCKSHCACTLIWPPELATCVCADPIDDSSATNASGKKTHGEGRALPI